MLRLRATGAVALQTATMYPNKIHYSYINQYAHIFNITSDINAKFAKPTRHTICLIDKMNQLLIKIICLLPTLYRRPRFTRRQFSLW